MLPWKTSLVKQVLTPLPVPLWKMVIIVQNLVGSVLKTSLVETPPDIKRSKAILLNPKGAVIILIDLGMSVAPVGPVLPVLTDPQTKIPPARMPYVLKHLVPIHPQIILPPLPLHSLPLYRQN
jgi:hypothetical protein